MSRFWQKFPPIIKQSASELEIVQKKLTPRRRDRVMSKIHLLKWPFEQPELDRVMSRLNKYEQNMISALQVDQM
jgi:hypothetical protein